MSSFIAWCSEKMLDIIYVLLNLLKLVLCTYMLSILFQVHLKRMCILGFLFFGFFFFLQGAVGNVVPCGHQLSNCSTVSFRISVALLIFCLQDLSIDVSGVLKSPTTIICPSVFPFMHISICFIYLGAPKLGTYILTSWYPLPVLIILSLYCPSLSFLWTLL